RKMIYLSIIVPVRNEERFITETLKALIQQDYPRDRFEILVVDGRSTDDTRLAVAELGRQNPDVHLRLLDNPGLLSSRARNIGIKEAKGKLVAVIDGHVYIPGNLLFADMERLKEKNGVLCLSRPAPLDVPGIEGGMPYWIAVARKCWLGHSTKSFIYSDYEGFVDPMSAGFAYDREVFAKVGYFDESFDAAEDVEFHYRLKQAGIAAYTSPSLLIYSYPRESLASLFRQQTRYGEGRARLVKKHPEAFTKETLIPVGIFCITFLGPLCIFLLPTAPFFAKGVVAVLMLYCGVLFATGVWESWQRRHLFFPGFFVAAAVWITHFGLGWGFVKAICNK
ncbi:MAG: glycosyltransferase, partial [Desulfobulbaceae bacterium]|nr:glycosyltransferase [Desulfobulbaceae bacterium]